MAAVAQDPAAPSSPAKRCKTTESFSVRRFGARNLRETLADRIWQQGRAVSWPAVMARRSWHAVMLNPQDDRH